MTKKFIKTSDSDTKETLLKLGFRLISEDSNGISTFLNDATKVVTYDDKSKNMKYSYSNILSI